MLFTKYLIRTVPNFAFGSPTSRELLNPLLNNCSHFLNEGGNAYTHDQTIAYSNRCQSTRLKGNVYENSTPNSETTSAKSTERSPVEEKASPALSLNRRIGSTYYTVNVHFSDKAKQTMEDKLLHMIRNEIVDFDENCGIISSATNEPPV